MKVQHFFRYLHYTYTEKLYLKGYSIFSEIEIEAPGSSIPKSCNPLLCLCFVLSSLSGPQRRRVC